MSSNDEKSYSIDPEKTGKVEEKKKDVGASMAYQIPKSTGVVIEFGKVLAIIIDREKLEIMSRELLMEHKAMIMFDVDHPTMYLSITRSEVDVAFAIEGNLNDCNPSCEETDYWVSTTQYHCYNEEKENYRCTCRNLVTNEVRRCCPTT